MIEVVGPVGLVFIAGVAGVLGWAAGMLVAATGANFLLADSLAPDARCRRVERLAMLPLAGAMLAVAALLLPALFKLIGLIDDHCLAHGLHHPHFCLRHLPAVAVGPVTTAFLLSGVVPIAGLVRWAIARIQEARLLGGIERMALSRHGVITTDLDAPRAFLFGLRRPRIVLSTGLRQLLAPAECRAVVRHEIAHARVGDPARRCALGFLLALHLPQTGRYLQRQWNQATEERADDSVAARGQGLELARALIKILRRRNDGPRPVAHPLGVDSADVARRIRRLADDAHDLHPSPRCEWLLTAAVLMIAVTIASRHHMIETMAGWVIGG